MPKGYWIAHVDVRDPEGYKDYVAAAKLAFDKYGAKFLARGGAYEATEGRGRARNVVIEFPSLQAAQDCYHSPEYQAARRSARNSPMPKWCWSRALTTEAPLTSKRSSGSCDQRRGNRSRGVTYCIAAKLSLTSLSNDAEHGSRRTPDDSGVSMCSTSSTN